MLIILGASSAEFHKSVSVCGFPMNDVDEEHKICFRKKIQIQRLVDSDFSEFLVSFPALSDFKGRER